MNMSTTQPGTWVDGIDMLKQSIAQYFKTVKGSIPMHPELGFGIYEYVDRNPGTIMDMVREISKGMQLWDSRINVLRATPTYTEGKLSIYLLWALADDDSNTFNQVIPI
jgi:phage baseplate assembly protein W